MLKRVFSLFLCLVLFACLIPSFALAEVDYDDVVIQKGDTVRDLLAANSLAYDDVKYVVMVLNRMEREYEMETLTIGDVIKIPKAPKDIIGSAPHLISADDEIACFVIPYSITAGDTLKNIYKLWGLDYDEYVDLIRSLNPGKDLDLLYVGALYYLPTTEKNLKTKVHTTVMSHVMRENETVGSVISRYGIDFDKRREELQRYNPVGFDQLQPGDTLLIPLLWD